MEKIIDTIKNRYSPRYFSDKAPSINDLDLLFDAAKWAASSYNLQPWRFYVGHKELSIEMYKTIFESLTDFNKDWAKTAPVLIATTANILGVKGAINKHAWHDLGLAVGNLSNQATAMGLLIHQMGGFSHDVLIEKLQLPENIQPVSVIALGYLGNIQDLPDYIQKIEKETKRERKDNSDFVFYGI